MATQVKELVFLHPVKQKAKARIGASAGLGLKFNLNNKWAIDVEARGAIAPSIFGNISDHRKAEGTGMITAGVSYTFGGKKFAKVEDRVVEKRSDQGSGS